MVKLILIFGGLALLVWTEGVIMNTISVAILLLGLAARIDAK
jgi:hypothetical protein